MGQSLKARYWCGVLYPENMIPDWKDQIGRILQNPICYCVHDKDTLSDHVEDRKEHVHVMNMYNGPTTAKKVMKDFDKLSLPGKTCISTVEDIINVKSMYGYLIHDTEDCRKKGKHLYDKSERIECNNFDIGRFEQLSQQEKDDMSMELTQDIILNQFTNFFDFLYYVLSEYDITYYRIARSESAYFERTIRGLYLKTEEQKKKQLEKERRQQVKSIVRNKKKLAASCFPSTKRN